MRILAITKDALHGGAAKVATAIHDFTNAQPGEKSTFLSARASRSDGHTLALGVSALRFRMNVLAHRLNGAEGPFNRVLWVRFLAEKLQGFDVVHLHNTHGYYLPVDILSSILEK